MGKQRTDSGYFMRRASEERAAAQRARDPRARQSHIDLAERYSQAAKMAGADNDDEEQLDQQAPMSVPQPEFGILP